MKKQIIILGIALGFLSPLSMQSMVQRPVATGTQAVKSLPRVIPKQTPKLYTTQPPKKGLTPSMYQKMNLKPETVKKLEATKEKAKEVKTRVKEFNVQRRPGFTSDADNRIDRRITMIQEKINQWLAKDPESTLQPTNPYAILDVKPGDSFETIRIKYGELMKSLQQSHPQYYSRLQRLNLRDTDAQNIRTAIHNAYNMIFDIKLLEDSVERLHRL